MLAVDVVDVLEVVEGELVTMEDVIERVVVDFEVLVGIVVNEVVYIEVSIVLVLIGAVEEGICVDTVDTVVGVVCVVPLDADELKVICGVEVDIIVLDVVVEVNWVDKSCVTERDSVVVGVEELG